MKKNLTIDLNSLPEEGKTYSGELDGTVFSSEKGRSTSEPRAAEPLYYDLYIQRFDQELLVRGSLSVEIEFTCVRCLNKYVKTVAIEECAISLEIISAQIDLINELREEIVILFPDYPHCDEGDTDQECILDSRYLAVDKPPEDEVKTPAHEEVPTPWAALDNFDEDADTDS